MPWSKTYPEHERTLSGVCHCTVRSMSGTVWILSVYTVQEHMRVPSAVQAVGQYAARAGGLTAAASMFCDLCSLKSAKGGIEHHHQDEACQHGKGAHV